MSKFLFIILGVITILSGGYFTYSQKQLKALNEEVATLRVVNEANEETIKKLNTSIKAQEQATLDLQKKLQQAESYSDDLQKKIRTYNLRQKSIDNSSQTQNRVNGATNRLFRSLESDTGVNRNANK